MVCKIIASTKELSTRKAISVPKWDMPEDLGLALICEYYFYFSKEVFVAIPDLQGTTSMTQGIMDSWTQGQ